MRKRIGILILAIIIPAFSVGLIAEEKSNVSTLFAVSKEAKTKLKTGQTVAIFLNGNDVLFTRIMEDALDIYLTNAGFNVVNRERLEKIVGEQIDKKSIDKAARAINALEIGKIINAEWIVTGTAIIEPNQQNSLILKIGSFQFVDPIGEKTLINAIFEPAKGKSLSETAKEFADIVKLNMQ